MAERAECPKCHGRFVVKKDGTMRMHVSDVLPPDGRWRRNCPGVDQAPAPAEETSAGATDA